MTEKKRKRIRLYQKLYRRREVKWSKEVIMLVKKLMIKCLSLGKIDLLSKSSKRSLNVAIVFCKLKPISLRRPN